MANIHNFYKDLPTLDIPLSEVLQPRFFVDVPDNWYIIIADIKDSTAAVSSGKHNDVNLVAASAIIAALNEAKRRGVDIPFFFAGDGATIFVPEQLREEVIRGLKLHNANSLKNFGLEMHLGYIGIKDIKEAGHFVRIAKVKFGKELSKPLVIGDGIKYAEKMVKQAAKAVEADVTQPNILNLEGLECRWDKVRPPLDENEVVCYLIESIDPQKQIEVYRGVLQKIEEIFGSLEARNPLSVDRLKLLVTFQKLRTEIMAKFGTWKAGEFITTFLKTFLGRFLINYNFKINNVRGQEYLKQVISNADILTIDGRINTIISANKEKRIRFLQYLSVQEKEGRLVYGHFISKESVITCYIENRESKHIHFVDGSDGGYTEAAKELKTKFIVV